MSEMKCKCGAGWTGDVGSLYYDCVEHDPRGVAVRCSACGRSGPVAEDSDAASRMWAADRLAEEQAREALAIAATRMQRLLDEQEHCDSYEYECPLHDAHKDYDIAGELPKLREALRLLEAR